MITRTPFALAAAIVLAIAVESSVLPLQTAPYAVMLRSLALGVTSAGAVAVVVGVVVVVAGVVGDAVAATVLATTRVSAPASASLVKAVPAGLSQAWAVSVT